MKKIFLFMAVITMVVAGCGEDKLAELKFCSDIRPDEPCIGEDTIFMQGTNVWAQLYLKPGFTDSIVTGILYGYEDGKRVLIESIKHEIGEGQQVIMEAMFFNSKGNFEVEFSDSNGNLLDKRGFEIL
ncbi:MAG: hypothetical protein WD578_13680 [Bacteroidales bacterium]